MATDNSFITIRIEEARRNVINNEASDQDWMLLIMRQQCEKLDAIRNTVEETNRIATTAMKDRDNALSFIKDNWKFILLAVAPSSGIAAAITQLG